MARWDQSIAVPSTPIADGTYALSKNIGFPALSIAIDNLTGYWLYIPAANAFIPPWWTGVVVNPVHTTDYAYLQWKSPFGGSQSTSTPNLPDVAVNVVLVDYYIPAAPGSLGGGVPVTTENPSTPAYSATGMVITNLGVLTPIAAIEPSSSGYSLQSLSFTTPSVAQTYSIFRANGLSSVGPTIIPINLLDPSIPAFNGIVRYQGNTLPPTTVIVGNRNTGSGGTISLTIPSTALQDDVLIAYIHTTGADSTLTGPSDWTLKERLGGGAVIGTQGIFTKIASSSDAGTVINFSNPDATDIIGFIIVVREVRAVYSNETINTVSASTVASWISTTATTPGVGIAVSFANNASVTFTPSTEATELIDETLGTFRVAVERYSYTVSPTAPTDATWSAAVSQSNSVTLIKTTSVDDIKLLAPYSTPALATTASIPTAGTTIVDFSTLGIVARSGAAGGLVVVPNTSAVSMTLDLEVKQI